MTPCPYCDNAAVVDEYGCCIHCGADRTAPPCGKLGVDRERIVWMCALPDGHAGECSYGQRAGTLPPPLDSPSP